MIQRQILDYAPPPCGPMILAHQIFCELSGESRGKGERGVSPAKILHAIGYGFNVIERLGQVGFRPMGKRRSEISAWLGRHNADHSLSRNDRHLAYRAARKSNSNPLEIGKAHPIVDSKNSGATARGKRRMGHGGDTGDVLLPNPDIPGPVAKIVIRDQQRRQAGPQTGHIRRYRFACTNRIW